MKIEDIITLAKAGFTADQISRFAAISQPQPQTQPQPRPQPQQENDFAAQLSALTAAIHANGILGSEQPKQETAEDILASIINPPVKEVK